MALSDLDLSYHFDANLREVFTAPEDARRACRELEELASAEAEPLVRAKLLAELGGLQRALGHLNAAETSLALSLKLLEGAESSKPRRVAARIRLAHVFHWQRRYAEADRLFRQAAKDAERFQDGGLLMSFALQHLGKSLFDQDAFEPAIQCFYDAMMIRVKLGRDDLADSSRFALNRAVERLHPPIGGETEKALMADERMPHFVREVLGKSHASGELPRLRSNCLTAVFNCFLEPPYHFAPAAPLDAIDFLKSGFCQLSLGEELVFGDLLVFWSRSGGTWDHRRIEVTQMDIKDADFPYGLVFEHIAMVVEDHVVFHKPSPALEVPYKFDSMEAVRAGLRPARGFEMTLHRRKSIA